MADRGRGGIVFVSAMLMMPDITVPLGISCEHHALSILVYLHPVCKLLDAIIILCVCMRVRVYMFVYGRVCFCIVNNRLIFHPESLLNDTIVLEEFTLSKHTQVSPPLPSVPSTHPHTHTNTHTNIQTLHTTLHQN